MLTLFVYGAALALPFFFDDFVHLPFVDAHSLADIWRTAGTLAYYRPLSFTIWKIMALLLGQHNQFLQHGFNLLLARYQRVSGWLVSRSPLEE